jgi:hypothetical protein
MSKLSSSNSEVLLKPPNDNITFKIHHFTIYLQSRKLEVFVSAAKRESVQANIILVFALSRARLRDISVSVHPVPQPCILYCPHHLLLKPGRCPYPSSSLLLSELTCKLRSGRTAIWSSNDGPQGSASYWVYIRNLVAWTLRS